MVVVICVCAPPNDHPFVQKFTEPASVADLRSFDYYRCLIKRIEGGLGVDMERATAQAFIHWHHARLGPRQALLPQLSHLSLSFLGRDAIRMLSVRYRRYVQDYYNTIPSTLSFLDIVIHDRITSLSLRIDGERAKTEWQEIRPAIEARLGSLVTRCKLRTLDLTGDIPIELMIHLHRASLREVTLQLGSAPAPQPEVAMRLWDWLSNLPNLRVLSLGKGTLGGFEPAITSPDPPKGSAELLPSGTYTFPTLLDLRACPRDLQLQGSIPAHTRHRLRSLQLELRWDDCTGIYALSDSIMTCPNIENLSVTWSRALLPGGDEWEFPWEAVVSLTNLVSLSVKDIWNALVRPRNQHLKTLATACPRLKSFVWQTHHLPIRDRRLPAEATLLGLASLAPCPIVVLDIPIHVSGPYMEIPSRRFSSHSFRLGYGQWTYAQQDRAAMWIRDFFEDICPLNMRLKDWLDIDHGSTDTKGRDEVRAMWQGLEASLE